MRLKKKYKYKLFDAHNSKAIMNKHSGDRAILLNKSFFSLIKKRSTVKPLMAFNTENERRRENTEVAGITNVMPAFLFLLPLTVCTSSGCGEKI